MEKVFATPKEGVLVRHENGKPLDPAGESVDRTSFWLRRERDGDVTLTEVPAPAVAEPETTAPAKKSAKAEKKADKK